MSLAAAAAASSAIGGGTMVHRVDSTGGFIDWRRRRKAAVLGTIGLWGGSGRPAYGPRGEACP